MYRIVYVKGGPVFTKPTLRDAKKYVEKYTPLKNGWRGIWIMAERGYHVYVVQNSKGREVNNVVVHTIK